MADWEEDLASLVTESGISYQYSGYGGAPARVVEGEESKGVEEQAESLKDMMEGFFEASRELIVELGKSCRDILRHSLVGVEDSPIVRSLRTGCVSVAARLEFLNEYLPEDREPAHAWPVIVLVFLLAIVASFFSSESEYSIEPPRKVQIHPPSASHIQLPDGRNLSYCRQGVPAENARFSMVVPHSFLSSRLSGIPGIKESLLQEFGVHLVAYDLPGFGESDPHPRRDLNSSATDMLFLANALGIQDKFWVLGHSSGGMHAWAALRYIPSKLAGAILFAPMVNPYESKMTKEEKHKIWVQWSSKRKFLYILARKFPSFLPYFYWKSFLSGEHGEPENLLSLSLGKKDKALMGERAFKAFWERNMEESIRQRNSNPFVEEAILQVSSWGFSLADLQASKSPEGNGFLNWLKSFYSLAERKSPSFDGPIHVWQGTEDRVVPPTVADYVQRVLPETLVHRLSSEGHFSYFYFCDECHRHVFTTVFGPPQGPIEPTDDSVEDQITVEVSDGDLTSLFEQQ
ncbi:alpha/beta-Hydrolases superfamily protein [Wolffia australiana]